MKEVAMSRIAVLCPHCGREGKLPESVKTMPKKVKCPGCQRDFQPASAAHDEFTVVPEGTEQLKETAKRAATAIGDGIKQTARKAKDYAESDQARALMERTRRTAAEVGEKAKVTVSSMQGSGTRFLENPIVIGLSMLFCFPIGLFFVWRHSRWSKVAKSAWTGAFCAILVLMLIRGSQIRQETKAALSEADARWQAGDHAAAVAKYRSVLLMLDNDDKPLAYGRIIDHDIESGNAGAARKLIEEALGRGIHPSVNNAEAKSLLARIEREASEAKILQAKREEESAKPTEEESAKSASGELLELRSTPEASTPLVVKIGAKAQVGVFGKNSAAQLDRSLSIKAYKNSNSIIIDVKCDIKRAFTQKWETMPYLMPLLIRIFDEDGQYLTHFVTQDRFTISPKEFEKFQSRQNITYRFHLLKLSGDRFVYGVNRRDLRDAAMVEIGFFDPGDLN
jgi:hypothetical protein